jgi:hypothetical protein
MLQYGFHALQYGFHTLYCTTSSISSNDKDDEIQKTGKHCTKRKTVHGEMASYYSGTVSATAGAATVIAFRKSRSGHTISSCSSSGTAIHRAVCSWTHKSHLLRIT